MHNFRCSMHLSHGVMEFTMLVIKLASYLTEALTYSRDLANFCFEKSVAS